MRSQRILHLLLLAAVALLVGCAQPGGDQTQPTIAAETTPAPEAGGDAGELPAASFYDLGEATVVQDNFAEDSRFRNMPVRLDGVIAAPPADGQTHPVVLILHGTHPGCPVVGEVDAWPCAPDEEQRNYAGFEYLVRELAARGYVALAPNINAENTFGFGEPVPGERLSQLLNLHMQALAAAAAGDDNEFGVELAGVADVSQLVLAGHSRGGEMANFLTRQYELDSAGTAAELGYGPVRGILMIAPAILIQGSTGTNVPLAVILPACDGDVMGLDGQVFYEAVRFQDEHSWATTALLEGANHNGFNTILGRDMIDQSTGRAGCETMLAPETQQQFLVNYAAGFLTAVLGASADDQTAALARLGADPAQPAPAELFGLPARVNSLPVSEDRVVVFAPPGEVTTNGLGGAIFADAVSLYYCPEGYTVEPELANCRRPNFVMPGNPAMAIIDWRDPSGLVFDLPAGAGDLSGYTTLTLRVAVDPISPLNAAGQAQTFNIRLRDGDGKAVDVTVGAEQPALQFPAGETSPSDFFEGGLFNGIVHLSAIRVPLAAFEGVDLSNVTEIALVFLPQPVGSLFVADVELQR